MATLKAKAKSAKVATSNRANTKQSTKAAVTKDVDAYDLATIMEAGETRRKMDIATMESPHHVPNGVFIPLPVVNAAMTAKAPFTLSGSPIDLENLPELIDGVVKLFKKLFKKRKRPDPAIIAAITLTIVKQVNPAVAAVNKLTAEIEGFHSSFSDVQDIPATELLRLPQPRAMGYVITGLYKLRALTFAYQALQLARLQLLTYEDEISLTALEALAKASSDGSVDVVNFVAKGIYPGFPTTSAALQPKIYWDIEL